MPCYAGWQSSLKRCIEATSISIYLSLPRTADALLHALQFQQTKGNLQSVRELRFSGHHCGTDAFVTLAAMCPTIQARLCLSHYAHVTPAVNVLRMFSSHALLSRQHAIDSLHASQANMLMWSTALQAL